MSELPEFIWSVGEEGSDPLVPLRGELHRMDQFAYSGHLERIGEDLSAIAGLGVRRVRYGMPWRLTEPTPGHFDWTLWDRALEACAASGLEPIIDLLHFGLPDDLPGFVDPSWIDRFVAYTEAFLERYPEPRCFTPVNEPGFTAVMSGLVGAWNDRLRSTEAYARVLSHVTLANLEALQRVRSDRDGWWIGAESFNVPVALDPSQDGEVARRRALGWLVWDLHLGIEPQIEARSVVDAIDRDVRSRIDALAIRDRLIAGHDFYPLGIQALGGEPREWSVEERLSLYEAEARVWYERYAVPFWVSETSNFSLPVDDQVPWLQGFVERIARLRDDGLPVRGLCWYSRGDQYDWQTFLSEPSGVVTEVGLFDSDRCARPVAAELSKYVAAGVPRSRADGWLIEPPGPGGARGIRSDSRSDYGSR